MEYNTLSISQLNDFVFCPYSIYLHNSYQTLDDEQFHDVAQTKGKQSHYTVDNASYSTKKDHITGMMVYSERFGLVGKIDQYFMAEKRLVERKRTIRKIYDGYKLQVYAQYFCLIEMGFAVDYIGFYSMTDNKNYALPLPSNEENDPINQWFVGNLNKIRNYKPDYGVVYINENKCRACIYASLCDQTTLVIE
ncbi:type V CRISPR-associated protein Cas4 [Acinetobacter sp. c2-A9]|uniref:type V CRISPR-associated protein Cas4 n=1 Tax=Acinetobacter sp. c2-A9 TaxID=3342802 RepID=UPI0035B822FF